MEQPDEIVNHSKVDLPDRNHCVMPICQRPTITANPRCPNYLCHRCYQWARGEGWLGQPWLNRLMNDECSRRHRRDRLMKQGVAFHTVPISALSNLESERLGLA